MRRSTHRSLRAWMVLFAVLAVLVDPSAASAGVDEDGRRDVVFAEGYQSADYLIGVPSSVCLGQESEGFACRDISGDFAAASDVAVTDMNSDGHLDLLVADTSKASDVFDLDVPSTDQVCLGSGSGAFACEEVGTSVSGTVAVGDVNGDGDADAVFGNRVCLGDGDGDLACTRNVAADGVTRAIADLDGDRHPDLVLTNWNGPSSVCMGAGSGDFSCSDLDPPSRAGDAAVGDVDGDGHLDVVLAALSTTSRVCLGDGSGVFGCRDVHVAAEDISGVALGDMNEDGHLDAVFAVHDFLGPSNELCLGDGSGNLSCDDVFPPYIYALDLAIDDLNRDDHLDVVFATEGGRQEAPAANQVCYGDGDGHFRCSTLGSPDSYTVAVAIASGFEGRFRDDEGSIFEADIDWIGWREIARGCDPPRNGRFCPEGSVTRGEMAALLARALDLDPVPSGFSDTGTSVFGGDIGALAGAGITKGCNPPDNTMFCPDDVVTRGQMAAFLVRAIGFTAAGGGAFTDDQDSGFESDIDRLATAGVARGCNPPDNDRFCPTDPVSRGQMAALLHRALGTG